MDANIQWSRVICRQDGNYLGWPTIASRSNGELLVVFSGDREEHACPYGKTQMIRSSDQGISWSKLAGSQLLGGLLLRALRNKNFTLKNKLMRG